MKEGSNQRRTDHRDLEAAGGRTKVADLAREHGISEATIYTWKGKYGDMEVSEAQRLKSLEDENRRLKHLVADLSLDKEVLKAVITKNGWSSQLNGKL
jgi:putative transposase